MFCENTNFYEIHAFERAKLNLLHMYVLNIRTYMHIETWLHCIFHSLNRSIQGL